MSSGPFWRISSATGARITSGWLKTRSRSRKPARASRMTGEASRAVASSKTQLPVEGLEIDLDYLDLAGCQGVDEIRPRDAGHLGCPSLRDQATAIPVDRSRQPHVFRELARRPLKSDAQILRKLDGQGAHQAHLLFLISRYHPPDRPYDNHGLFKRTVAGRGGAIGESDGPYAEAPASTTRLWPVIAAAFSESRKSTASATAPALVPPGRHSPLRRCATAASGTPAVRSVATKPGTTALTRTPRLPTSRASERVRPRMPALEAA